MSRDPVWLVSGNVGLAVVRDQRQSYAIRSGSSRVVLGFQ